MILHNTNFYQDIQQLASVISNLEFKDAMYGKEVDNFQHLPPGIAEHISQAVGTKLSICLGSGVFRKPSPVLHFEQITNNIHIILAVALEETSFNTYEHESGVSSALQIKDMQEFIKNELNEEKLKQISKIILKPNDFIAFNPWMWHSFDEKLIQIFYLEISSAV